MPPSQKSLLLGRHPFMTLAGSTKPPSDPRKYLSGDLGWRSPDSTFHVQEFVAAQQLRAGEATYLLPSGQVAVADHEDLTQLGKYSGIAVTDAAVGESVFVQMFGLMTYPLPVLEPGKAVWLGQNGELVQVCPSTGYRLCVGQATKIDEIILQAKTPVVTYASSDALPWDTGQNGGVESLDWSTLQDLRDGIKSRHLTAPDVIHAYIDEIVEQYGLTPDKIATAAEIAQGTDKVVIGEALRQYLTSQGGVGGVVFASTTEIMEGTAAGKVLEVTRFHPILEQLLEGSGGGVELATVADTIAGTRNDVATTPFGVKAVADALKEELYQYVDDNTGGGTGEGAPRATLDQVRMGANVNAYVAPSEFITVLNERLAEFTPTTAGYFTQNITGDGTTTTFLVEHELGVEWPVVDLFDSVGNEVAFKIVPVDDQSCNIEFDAAPAADAVLVMVAAGGAGGGGGIAEIPFATQAEFDAAAVGKVATIQQIHDYAGSGGVPTEVLDRITALETAMPVIGTRADVVNGTADPKKIANIEDMRYYVAQKIAESGGGVTGEVATPVDIVTGEGEKIMTVSGVMYMMNYFSSIRTDPNGYIYLEGLATDG